MLQRSQVTNSGDKFGFPILLDLDHNDVIKACDGLSDQGFKTDGFKIDITNKQSVQSTIEKIKYKSAAKYGVAKVNETSPLAPGVLILIMSSMGT